ncbi:unnamed protein product [Rotaria sordida]|nr:unnamed protein product [Rotaria sordida]
MIYRLSLSQTDAERITCQEQIDRSTNFIVYSVDQLWTGLELLQELHLEYRMDINEIKPWSCSSIELFFIVNGGENDDDK